MSYADATGRLVAYIPPGDELDEFLGLVRIGVKFAAQHTGKKPGALSHYLLGVVRSVGPDCTFEQLIDRLEDEMARHRLFGADSMCVENVNRVWEIVNFHDPRKGAVDITFGTLRNRLTEAKKILQAEKTITAKP